MVVKKAPEIDCAEVHIFGVRHLSPAASFHLIKYLDKIKPEAVLIEGPSDASGWIKYFAAEGTRPPLAILAYTNEMPVQSILYPFSEYSPEYTAAVWALENKIRVDFIDLPCSVFLGQKCIRLEETEKKDIGTEDALKKEVSDPTVRRISLYDRWAEVSGYEDYDTYWEAEFEHNLNEDVYRKSAIEFGKSMRELEEVSEENLIREAFMRRQIQQVIRDGIKADKIVVVTGAYHSPVLNDKNTMTDAELKKLPSKACSVTLMPYSNLRLSSRTGYGAGNESPRYFQLMWETMKSHNLESLSRIFFTEVARSLRKSGTFKSTAEVIEAVRLANGLASLRGQSNPTLSDLRDAAVTCLGTGEVSVVAKALAEVEVGTQMGALPAGVSRTAIQDDFYKQLEDLKLAKYCTPVAETLELDLRENRSVKSEKSQWLDLNRSYYLRRLEVLGNPFAQLAATGQQNATWKEVWNLQWTTEAEIQLVEASLKGESVEIAAAYELKDTLDNASSVTVISEVIEKSAKCGMPSMLTIATRRLQEFTIDSGSFEDIATALVHLSSTVKYGDIRRMDTKGLLPLISQLFLRGSLVIIDNSNINQTAAHGMFAHMHDFNKIALDHTEIVDEKSWISVLKEMADRDDISAPMSGYACALLLERNLVTGAELEQMVVRRLSPGISADIGAGWFEGLAGRNHYSLIARPQIWQLLDDYIVALEFEEFTTALVYLRRTFSSFSPEEKRSVFDKLSELWRIEPQSVENKLTSDLDEDEQASIDSLNDFDFEDF